MGSTRANEAHARAGDGCGCLLDARGRRLDYLRLSVTDACNLRCRYCLPGDGVFPSREPVLGWDELLRIARLLGRCGVRKIRLTGGEPLVRRGTDAFVRRLRDRPDPPDVFLTTNGTTLERHLTALAEAGVTRLNVSLDSLRRDVYRRIAGRDALDVVLRSLAAADAAGFALKLNVVVLAGINDDEIPAFVDLVRERPWTVRFIEAMPFDGRGGRAGERLDGDAILARVRARHRPEPAVSPPAAVEELYRVPGHAGRIGVIRAWTRHFCGRCTRLRVSARGELRTCLYGDPQVDLGRLMRAGADDRVLEEAVRAAVRAKPADGRAAAAGGCPGGSMSAIGG